MVKREITQELLKELFEYRDGLLIWKIDQGVRGKAGTVAGSLRKPTGYFVLGIDNKTYQVHRLIYLYFHGILPKYLDHIDQNRVNNNIENLRPASSAQNQQNRKKCQTRAAKASKWKGVCWHPQQCKWYCRIGVNGKLKHLGLFDDELEAAKTYNRAAIEYFGEFASLNSIAC